LYRDDLTIRTLPAVRLTERQVRRAVPAGKVGWDVAGIDAMDDGVGAD
jgi:hypothetical protein